MPSFIGLLVGVSYMAFSIMSFRSSYLFLDEKAFSIQLLEMIPKFLDSNPTLTLSLIVVAAIVVVFYLFLPTLFEGSVIQYISRKKNGQEIGLARSLIHGWKSYLPLLEFHAIARSFSIIYVLTQSALILRGTSVEIFSFFFVPMMIIGVVGLLFSLLFTYSEYFIVIDEEEVFKSISKSVSLVLLHWQHTILIGILMLIIGARIIFNIIIILAVPAIFVLSAGIIAAFGIQEIGIFIGVALGILTLFFASYFAAIISIFANTVWTFTFLKLSREEEPNAREEIAGAEA